LRVAEARLKEIVKETQGCSHLPNKGNTIEGQSKENLDGDFETLLAVGEGAMGKVNTRKGRSKQWENKIGEGKRLDGRPE